ncbi:alpha/beta fold hydrolase [Vibrio tapetis]|uniref:Uncharacterized protein n=1 Tax=Vibrio tapetis subsp. tapetis TaxID=1671868 RepID=A0A2N8ZBU7_9VIBR|nr:alpha/beta fold hydrolase [Vibrio tapetis]SON49367.1 conserved protein of unknown function [Vibrio tapetis subsp. tapetis]
MEIINKITFSQSLVALAITSVLSGCGGGGSDDFESNKGDLISGCPTNLTCDYLSVAKDYDNPQQGNVNIFYGVHKARVPSERLGILVFNFGGPGGSAVSGASYMVSQWLPSTILDRFDVIGMDPRGSGQSAFAKELTACAVANDCTQVNRDFAHYMGSNSVVKDLDSLREALGEEKLNFLGYSYGTRLGSLYANMFPQNVRAIVLDSPMPPKSNNYIDLRIDNAKGYDAVADYRLITPERKKRLEAVANDIYVNGVYVDKYGSSLSVDKGRILLSKLSSRDPSKEFSDMKSSLFSFLDNDYLNNLLGDLSISNGNSPTDDDYRSSAMFQTVVCTDERVPVESNEVANYQNSYQQASAIYGPMNYQDTASMCVDWPGERDSIEHVEHVERMDQVLSGQKILVIGGKYDPATPYIWAEQMKQSFGTLAVTTTVTNRVDHGFSYSGIDCVDSQTTAYLLDPTQTLSDKSCLGTYSSSFNFFNPEYPAKTHPAKTVSGF